jgi:dihydrofolate reductase
MSKLTSFTFISLDGYFKGPQEDISWHQHGEEEGSFSAENLKSGNILLFGRKTFQMMESFWPTQMAFDLFPDVAKGMNGAEKIVFSRTLSRADWMNTRVINQNLADEIRKLKAAKGKDLTLLGSGNLQAQLAEEDLIDEYQFMLDPVALGSGTPVFNGIRHHLRLQLIDTRVFRSGSVLLRYKPV